MLVVLVGVVSAEAVLVAVASVAVASVVVLAAAGSEAGLSAVDSVVQVFAATSSGVPALDRASASVTVSSFRNRFAFAAVPFAVGAGFYGALCWSWAPTAWGWQRVWVCGYY
jgi:hypothetical protein